jgi:hypothetical protein
MMVHGHVHNPAMQHWPSNVGPAHRDQPSGDADSETLRPARRLRSPALQRQQCSLPPSHADH